MGRYSFLTTLSVAGPATYLLLGTTDSPEALLIITGVMISRRSLVPVRRALSSPVRPASAMRGASPGTPTTTAFGPTTFLSTRAEAAGPPITSAAAAAEAAAVGFAFGFGTVVPAATAAP